MKWLIIADSAIKILDTSIDMDMFFPCSFSPFQKSQTELTLYDRSMMSWGAWVLKNSFRKKRIPPNINDKTARVISFFSTSLRNASIITARAESKGEVIETIFSTE